MLTLSTSSFLETAKSEELPVQFNAAAEYSSELLHNLNLLFADECLCDVGLVVHPGRLIRAHRCVLSAASPYFHAMLTGGLRESGLDIIDMQAVGAAHIIEKLVAFIYTGRISVNSAIVQDLLEAADMLQLRHVVDICCSFLLQQLHESNCIGIYLFADAHSCIQLRDAARLFILENFRGIVRLEEFVQLPVNILLRFLQSDELHIEAEYEVLDAALHWLDSEAAGRRRATYDVMATVRLSLIPLSVCERSIAACKDLGIKFAVQKLVRDVHATSNMQSSITVQPRRHTRQTVYIVGGYCRDVGARWSDSTTLSRVDGFETYLRVWGSGPALSLSRSGVVVVTLNGALYAIGGESDSLISDCVECFDPVIGNRWQTVKSLTVPRCSAGACAVDERLYVFGGWIGAEIGTSMEFYDPRRKRWTIIDTLGGVPRYAMGVVEYNGLVYIVGGLNEMNEELQSVDIYNPVTERLSHANDMQTKRAYVGVAVVDGFIYAVGGWNEKDGALPTVERYSITEDEWIYVSPMSTARAGVSVAAISGLIYAFGGRTSSSEFCAPVTLSSVECYYPELDEWMDAGQMPVARCEAGIGVL